MSRILVTGADGFVGRALVEFLRSSGESVGAVVRRAEALSGAQVMRIPDIRTASWEPMLQGVDAVIHLAARAHVVHERSSNPLADFRAVNVRPTVELFRACQAAGVGRFLFVSSIGVNGKATVGRAFTETDTPRPVEPYAVSKWEAEEALRALRVRGSTNLIVVRPALIYGPYAKGNFLRLMRWVDSGWLLPFGAVDARRTFLGLTAFCDLLNRCLRRPFDAEQLFVAGDSRTVTVPELLRALAAAMNVSAKLARVPVKWLSILAKLSNRSAELERLTTSLEVDSTRARTLLGWEPMPALGADLQEMVGVYLRTKPDGR